MSDDFIPMKPEDVYGLRRAEINAEGAASLEADMIARLQALDSSLVPAEVAVDPAASATARMGADKDGDSPESTNDNDADFVMSELNKLDPPSPAVPRTEVKGSNGLRSRVYEGAKFVGKGAVDFLDFVYTPLSAIHSAVVAPIAGNAKTVGDTFRMSGKAFMDRLSHNPDAESAVYSADIADRIAPDASPFVKNLLTNTVDLVTDPTVSVGLPLAKFIQKGLKHVAEHAAATGDKKEAVMGVFQAGVHQAIGTSLVDFGRAGNRIERLAIKADAGDAKALKKLDKELSKHVGAYNAALKLDDEDVAYQIHKVHKAIGSPHAPLYHYDNSIDVKQFYKEVAKGKAPKDKVLNLNLSRFNTTEDIDKMIAKIAREAKPYFAAQTKTQSHKETLLKAQTKNLTDLIGKPPAEFATEESVALNIALVSSAKQLHEIMVRAGSAGGTTLDQLAFNKALALHKVLLAKVQGVKAHGGRLVEAQKIVADDDRRMLGQVNNMMRAIEEDDSIKKVLQEYLRNVKDPMQLNRVLSWSDKSFTQKLRAVDDVIFELFTNSILSGPITHATNIVSNAGFTAMRPTEKFLQGLSAAARLDFYQAKHNMGETFALMHGLTEGIADSLRLIFRQTDWEGLKLPQEMLQMHEMSKLKLSPKITAEHLGLTGRTGAAVDYLGSKIRILGNALVAEDKAFKLVNYRMSVRQRAYAKSAAAAGDDPKKFQSLYNILVNKPDENIVADSIQDAAYYTFTDELGDFGKKAAKLVHTPGMRYLIPFFVTPVNISKHGTRHSVVGNVYKDLVPSLSRKDAVGDLARAKFSLGTLIPAALLMSLDDDVIVGGIDKSTATGRFEASIHDEYTINVGDQSFDFSKIEPFRTILGMAVNYKKAILNMNLDVDPETGLPTDKVQELAAAFVAPFLETIGDNFMLEALGGLMDMLDGVKSGNPDYAIEKAKRLAAAATVPAFVRQFNSSYMDTHFRRAEGYIENVLKGLPGYSKDLPTYKTLWGDDMFVHDDIDIMNMSPISTRQIKADKYDKEIVRLGVNLPREPKTITFNGIELELTPQQRSDFSVIRGKGPDGDSSLKNIIKETMDDPAFQELPDKLKRDRIEAILGVVTDNAKQILLSKDKDLQEQYKIKSQAMQSVMTKVGKQQ